MEKQPSGRTVTFEGGHYNGSLRVYEVSANDYKAVAKALLEGDNVITTEPRFSLDFTSDDMADLAEQGAFPDTHCHFAVRPYRSPEFYARTCTQRADDPAPTYAAPRKKAGNAFVPDGCD